MRIGIEFTVVYYIYLIYNTLRQITNLKNELFLYGIIQKSALYEF